VLSHVTFEELAGPNLLHRVRLLPCLVVIVVVVRQPRHLAVEEYHRDSDRANGGLTPTPSDAASDTSKLIIPSLVHAVLCIAVFLLMIPSSALVVGYAKLMGSFAAFDLHHNLQFGDGVFVSGP